MLPYPAARTFSISLVAALMALLLAAAQLQAAEALNADEIKAILKTTGTEEDGFVDRAVTLVHRGTLPRNIFESCLLWARRKPNHRFQYFKRALIARAAEIGVQVR